MAEQETATFVLTEAQADAILKGLQQAAGHATLFIQTGEHNTETTVLVDNETGECAPGEYEVYLTEGYDALCGVKLSHRATTSGDLSAVDALGVPWAFTVRNNQTGGSLRSAQTDAYFNDLERLAGHKHLEQIGLQKLVTITHIDAVKDLPALKSLTLYYCTALENIGAISGLPSLRSLTLGQSPNLHDLTPISSLSDLKTLWISGQTLPDISAIAKNTALTWLGLKSCNALVSLEP